jgi:REP element-mobilizing transposase RayT
MSLPGVASDFSRAILSSVDIPRRKSLPHEIPLWVDPQREIYFITINCKARGTNQLATDKMAANLFETVHHRQENQLWWPHIWLLMPDHVHALISFPPSVNSIKLIVRKWKEWTAKTLGIHWQRDFFEHRLRQEESRREKADYILQNPVRKKTGGTARRLAIRIFCRRPAPMLVRTARCAVPVTERSVR